MKFETVVPAWRGPTRPGEEPSGPDLAGPTWRRWSLKRGAKATAAVERQPRRRVRSGAMVPDVSGTVRHEIGVVYFGPGSGRRHEMDSSRFFRGVASLQKLTRFREPAESELSSEVRCGGSCRNCNIMVVEPVCGRSQPQHFRRFRLHSCCSRTELEGTHTLQSGWEKGLYFEPIIINLPPHTS